MKGEKEKKNEGSEGKERMKGVKEKKNEGSEGKEE